MTDIVKQLRSKTCGELSCDDCDDQRELAATEIERLRAAMELGEIVITKCRKCGQDVAILSDCEDLCRYCEPGAN